MRNLWEIMQYLPKMYFRYLRTSWNEPLNVWRLEIELKFFSAVSFLFSTFSGWRRFLSWLCVKKHFKKFFNVKHQSESNEGFRLLVLMLCYDDFRKRCYAASFYFFFNALFLETFFLFSDIFLKREWENLQHKFLTNFSWANSLRCRFWSWKHLESNQFPQQSNREADHKFIIDISNQINV